EPPNGLGEWHRLLGAEERRAGRHLERPPRWRRGERALRNSLVRANGLDRVAHSVHEALGARLGVLSHAEYGHDHVLGHELEVDVVELAHERGEAEPGAA